MRFLNVGLVAGMLFVASVATCQSKTIRVPADYPTIQAAINAASDVTNDTVLVSPGVYDESVSFNGKPALLISANGSAATCVNAVAFTSGETPISVISGFTITNGGIWVLLSSPTIISNTIVNCGIGVNSHSGSPNVMDNFITGCSGDGVYLQGRQDPYTAVIQGNIIRNNGAGIDMWAAGAPTIFNNLIQSNQGSGIGMVNQSDANITQNVIIGNAGGGINATVPGGARGPWIINNWTVEGSCGGLQVGEI